MSTKIYEAYKVDDSVSMLKLYKILTNIKKQVIPFYQTLALDESIIQMHRLMFSSTATEKEKELFKKTFGSGHRTDVTESCCVYFHKTGTYIQFFMAARFKHLYSDIKYFKDFHYQNQSDLPSGLTIKEWKNRKKIWNEILGTEGIPAKVGFIYNFYTYDDFDLQMWINASKRTKESEISNV